MMSFHPAKQLMQCVTTMPNALWGTLRLNIGYTGPIMRVRRSSDSATADCYSRADIVAHCTGANGFVSILYDQSGNSRLLAQASSGLQPKIYDSSTGLLMSGNNVVMSFDGSDDVLGRADICGIPTGDPSITTLLFLGTWTNTSSTAWSVGPDNFDGSGNDWYGRHPTSTELSITYRVGTRTFTCTDPSSGSSYLIYKKTAGDNISAVVMRQNKSTLSEASVSAGTHALALPGNTFLGCSPQGTQNAAMTVIAHGHWNANLSGADLDALEQYFEALRIS